MSKFPLENWFSLKRTYTHGVKTFYNDFHLGVDVIVPTGTPLFAPVSGEILAFEGNMGGKTIHLYNKKQDLVFRFLHLDTFSVKTGDKVKAGEQIGTTGNTGMSTAPHLHHDICKYPISLVDSSRFIDPDKYYNRFVVYPNRIINRRMSLKSIAKHVQSKVQGTNTGHSLDFKDRRDWILNSQQLPEKNPVIFDNSYVLDQKQQTTCSAHALTVGLSLQDGTKYDVNWTIKAMRHFGYSDYQYKSNPRDMAKFACKIGLLEEGHDIDPFSEWTKKDEQLLKSCKKFNSFFSVNTRRKAIDAFDKGYCVFASMNWYKDDQNPSKPSYTISHTGKFLSPHIVFFYERDSLGYVFVNSHGKKWGDKGRARVRDILSKEVNSLYVIK